MEKLTIAQKIIRGIELVEKHRPANEFEYHFRCAHDELIIGSLSWDVPVEEMEALGWRAIEEYDGFRYMV